MSLTACGGDDDEEIGGGGSSASSTFTITIDGNKREMNYFDQETIATEDNFTTLFHTDQGECGVAKKETKKRLLGIRSEEVVMTSEVKNYLEALFDELSKKSGIISKVKQSNKMSFLLWVISSGLDRMINEKCFV